MSKGSRILGALLALTLGATPAFAQRVIPLEEALSIAKHNNRDLAQAQARVEQAHAGVGQALAALLPTVAVQGKYTHNYKEVKLDLSAQNKILLGLADVAIQVAPGSAAAMQLAANHDALVAAANQGPIVIQPGEQLDFVASGTVPLLVPWAYPAFNAAKSTEKAGRANQAVTEAQVLLGTAQAYYACLGLDEAVQARKNGVQVAQKALDNARARLEAGVVNRVEVSRAELQLVRQQQALLESQDSQAQAYRSLATIMNFHEPLKVQGTPEPAQRPDADALISQALQLRPEFTALKLTIDVNRSTANSNLWRWAPSLSAFGNVRAFNYAGFSGDNYAWAVGLQADWVLYDGGIRDAARHLAIAQKHENEAKLSLLQDQVKDDVANADRALKTKRAALETAKRSVRLSKETLDLVQVQHDAGTATQLDLLQAQDALVGAELALAQARFDLSQGALTLDRLSGAFPGNLNLK
jgi:outer membrane protein TolC